MKTRILTTILLIALVGAFTTADAQSRHDKKLRREMAKLEKQMKKVRELQGNKFWFAYEDLNRVKEHELQRALVLKDVYRDKALRQKDIALREALEAKVWTRDFAREFPAKNWERFEGNWENAKDNQYKVFEIHKESLEQARSHQKEALEQAMQHQKEAMEHMKIQQKEMIEQLKMELEKAKQELKEVQEEK